MDRSLWRESDVRLLKILLASRLDRLGSFDDCNTLIERTSDLDPQKPIRLVSIDATDASVTGYGCQHFGSLPLSNESNGAI